MTMPTSTIRRLMIRDTGSYFINATPVSGETIAHNDGTNGSPLELFFIKVNMGIRILTEDRPNPGRKKGLPSDTNYDKGRWDSSDVDQNGMQIPIISGTVLFNQNKLEDMKSLGYLYQMTKTKGYKELILNPIPTSDKTVTGTLLGSPMENTAVPALSFYEFGDTGQPIGSINVRIVSMDVRTDASMGERVEVDLDMREVK